MIYALSLLLCMLFATVTQTHNEYIRQSYQAFKDRNIDQALDLAHKAQKIDPTSYETYALLAPLHFVKGHYSKAITYYEKCLLEQPNDPSLLYNCATCYCKVGNFRKALTYVEKASHHSSQPAIRDLTLKLSVRLEQWPTVAQLLPSRLWWYDEPIFGSTILLDLDKPGNGFGDSFQFIRYAQILHQAGAHVFVKVHPALQPLCQLCPYIEKVYTRDDTLPSVDKTYNICICSLLQCMKNMPASAHPVPYLYAQPDLITSWKQRLAKNPAFSIGLCWQSSFVKDGYTNKIIPSPRSLALDEFHPLIREGVTFYSLQQEITTPYTFPITTFGGWFDQEHGRFMDTAALIMNLDLVITVDTSIAHLAGALGKSVWLLLSCESDYRWFTNTSTTAWYPTMQIFRQHSYGDWKPTIEKISTELDILLRLRSEKQ